MTGRIFGLIGRCVSMAFAAREWLNVWQWADKNVTLSSKWTSQPGPYDSSYTHYLRGPMEALSDRKVRYVTIVKGAQVGFTTMLANFVMWLVVMEPGPTLLAMPSRKMARRFVRKELHPRFLECAALKEYLPSNLRTHFSLEEMYFRTMDFFVGGAGNAATLSSLPAKNALGDEIDKWGREDDKEASRKDLLDARTIGYIDTRKIVLGSTPTVPEGTISAEAEKGTCERYEAPCPCCGHYQEILFENLKFDKIKGVKRSDGSYDLDLVEKETTLECQNKDCLELIPQSKKRWMMRRGRWRVTNPNASADHRSFFISGEIGNLRWGSLVKIFLQNKDTPGGLHHFHNSYLGRAWIRTAGGTTKKMIRTLQDETPVKYELQVPQDPKAILKLPFRPVVITMHVDVQQTEFYFTMRAWDVDGSRYLLASGTCVSYQELVDISNRVWTWDHCDGTPLEEFSVWMGIIDSGYRAKRGASVYSFVHEQGGRWIASKGGTYRGKDAPIVETEVEHIYQGKQVTVPLLQYNDDIMQEHLYRFVIRERKGPLFGLPQRLEADYIAQVTARKLVKKKGEDGRTFYKYESDIDPHLGDCEKLGECFGFVLSKDTLVALRVKQDAARDVSVSAWRRAALALPA